MSEKTINTKFDGPIFLSGMPRSGTKLLRDLLNNHNLIAIPENESLFIPKVVRMIGHNPDFGKEDVLNAFWKVFRNSKFYGNQTDRGLNLSFRGLKEYGAKSWDELLRPLFIECSPKENREDLIWGDKTPGNIVHYHSLTKAFPNARFIHIIRDPRDYVCSVNNAWGRSVVRAAERWNRTMDFCDKSGLVDKENYIEVNYEKVTADTENVLKQICEFLDVEYHPGMDKLHRVTENLGDAKGKQSVLKNNFNKFREKLSSRQLKRVEEIVYQQLHRTGYVAESKATSYRPLGEFELRFYKLHDGFFTLKHNILLRGPIKGFRYTLKTYRDHSWRGTKI